jgi:hypothetical protein
MRHTERKAMNIYILDSDPQKIPALLADDGLSKMIEDIAQVLCNVHQLIKQKAFNAYNIPANRSLFRDEKYDALRQAIDDIPLKASGLCEFFDWAKTCAANYGYLVKLGLACCKEFYYRFNSERKDAEIVTVTAHPMQKIIEWADQNPPELYTEHNLEISDGVNSGWVEMQQTPFPLAIPDEFKIFFIKNAVKQLKNPDCFSRIHHPNDINIIGSYRNCYTHTLKDREFKFTRREVPEFLK